MEHRDDSEKSIKGGPVITGSEKDAAGHPVDASMPKPRTEAASRRHDGLSDEDRINRDAAENVLRTDAANARRDGLTLDQERARREQLARDNVDHPDPAAADQPAGGTKEERGSPDAGKDLPDPAPAKA